ncbi:MAG: DUF262 domain-containing protein, partial [Mycoplasmataceae bacterium]|nr:DUF262 domain-containing protein [Mycoplasmataceae bacterium]
VIDNKNNHHELVDGQQRITTIIIFCLAFFYIYKYKINKFDSIHKRNFKKLSDIFMDDYDVPKREYILNVSKKYDNSFLKKVFNILKKIEDNQNMLDDKAKIDNLRNTNNSIYSEIFFYLIDKNSSEKKFLEFNYIIETIRKDLSVVKYTFETSEDAYLLFETMNSRGKELDSSELIKNFVMSKSDRNDTEDLFDKWEECVNKLSDLRNINYDVESLIKNMTELKRQKKVSKKYVFKEFKKEYREDFKHTSLVENFVNELYDKGSYIALVDSFDKEIFSKESVSILKSLFDLGIKGIYPIIFAATTVISKRLKNKKINSVDAKFLMQKFAVSLSIFSIDYFLVTKSTANSLENPIVKITNDIYRTESIEPVRNLYNKTKFDRGNLDIFFKSNTLGDSAKGKKWAKLIFKLVTHKYNIENSTFSNLIRDNVDVDHIHAKNIKSSSTCYNDVTDEYIDNIGNLMPLNLSENRSVQNMCFSEKIKNIKISDDLLKNIYLLNKSDFNTNTDFDLDEFSTKELKKKIFEKEWKNTSVINRSNEIKHSLYIYYDSLQSDNLRWLTYQNNK